MTDWIQFCKLKQPVIQTCGRAAKSQMSSQNELLSCDTAKYPLPNVHSDWVMRMFCKSFWNGGESECRNEICHVWVVCCIVANNSSCALWLGIGATYSRGIEWAPCYLQLVRQLRLNSYIYIPYTSVVNYQTFETSCHQSKLFSQDKKSKV